MKSLRTLILAALLSGAFAASALTVDTTAGGLKAAVGAETDAATLTVRGTVDASDIFFIASEMTSLTDLDLSAASIAAYSGPRMLTGATDFPADELPAYSLIGTRISSLRLPAGIASIGEAALASSALTAVEFPATLTSIGDYAFAASSSFVSLNVPATVKSVGTGAFADCKALKTVTYAAAQPAVPARCFEGCSALKSVTFAGAVTEIGESAFANCFALKGIDFPAGLTAVGDRAFMASGLESADLTKCSSLKQIGEFAFADCRSLEQFELPAGVTLQRGTLFNDESLADVVIPTTSTVILPYQYTGIKVADPSVIPSTTTEIGDYAIAGWSEAKGIILPAKLEKLGEGAMANWTGLDSIDTTSLEQIPELGENVWRGVDQKSVMLVVNSEDMDTYKALPQWQDFDVVLRGTTGFDNISAEIAGSADKVNYAFRGDILVISTAETEILNVALYDVAGRCIYTAKAAGNVAEIDTSRWNGVVLLADVRLAGNLRSSTKIQL